MFSHTDPRRLLATVFAALFVSTLAIASAVGPAHSIAVQAA